MTLDSQVSIALLISLCTLIFSAYTTYSTSKRNIKADNEKLVEISTQLDNIQKTVDETKDELKRINNQIIEIIQIQTTHANEIKNIWREIHRMENEKEEE